MIPSLEPPAVRGKVSNHIADYITNPKTYSKEALAKGKETSIKGLENTFNRYKGEQAQTKEFITEKFNSPLDLLLSNLSYIGSKS